jgi:SPP1 family predicted phage head-tail adaptor
MDAGKLDRRVTLRSKATTQDAYGGQSVTWTDIAEVWARKLSSKGREFYSGGVTLSGGEVGIQIRRTPTVSVLTQLDVFVLDGKIYNIKSIDEVGRRDYLTIMGESGANDG